jgi:Polyketide cyclase / dehydrase and lipid transport
VKIRHEIEVARPPQAVFDFLVDTDSFPIVDRALVSFEPRGLMRVGLRGTFVHRRGGMTARSSWEVAELERPSRIRVAVRGLGYEMDEIATLSASGAGTLATFVDEVRPTSFAGTIMVALSGGIMRRDLERRTRLLKAALEADQVGAESRG